jgi:hypothetical protein
VPGDALVRQRLREQFKLDENLAYLRPLHTTTAVWAFIFCGFVFIGVGFVVGAAEGNAHVEAAWSGGIATGEARPEASGPSASRRAAVCTCDIANVGEYR